MNRAGRSKSMEQSADDFSLSDCCLSLSDLCPVAETESIAIAVAGASNSMANEIVEIELFTMYAVK